MCNPSIYIYAFRTVSSVYLTKILYPPPTTPCPSISPPPPPFNPRHNSRRRIHITDSTFCNFLQVPVTSLLLVQILPSGTTMSLWTPLVYLLLLESEASFQSHTKLKVKLVLYTLIFRPSNRPQKHELETERLQLCHRTKQRSLKHEINELNRVRRPWRKGPGRAIHCLEQWLSTSGARHALDYGTTHSYTEFHITQDLPYLRYTVFHGLVFQSDQNVRYVSPN
jgi:hypothetical protein